MFYGSLKCLLFWWPDLNYTFGLYNTTVRSTGIRSPSKTLSTKNQRKSMGKFCSLHFSLMAMRAIFGGRTRHRLVFMESSAQTKSL